MQTVGDNTLVIFILILSVLPTDAFHPCFRHDIQTTAAVFYLTSSGRSARSSLYSRQAAPSERPASPRRICAVIRGFQTTRDISIFPFLPRHYHMTNVCITNHHPCCWHGLTINAGHEIAGHENDGPNCRAWNCRTWNCRTWMSCIYVLYLQDINLQDMTNIVWK